MTKSRARELLEEIRTTKVVKETSGQPQPLCSEISAEEGEAISSLIRQMGFRNTLEIGCAQGISSLYICDALGEASNARHTLVDPHQMTDWKGVGVGHLKRAGFDFFELIEKPSEFALPALCASGRRFQFVLIDGWHTFDHALVDFFYVNRLLEEGGVVALDDSDWVSIAKLARYVARYPHYKTILSVGAPKRKTSLRHRWGERVFRFGAGFLPSHYINELFSDRWLHSDASLGIDGSMVFLQKTGPDLRNYDWFHEF